MVYVFSAAISLFLFGCLFPSSWPIFSKKLFKLWMMRSSKDSFVGSTLKRNFKSSTFGGALRDLTIKVHAAGNAYMHATTAVGPASITATLPDNLRNMIPLAGIDVAFTGIVKVDVPPFQHTSVLPF